MDSILQFDRVLFDIINQGWSNSIFDVVLPFLRGSKNWIPLYCFIIVFLIVKHRVKSVIPILSLIVLIGISDTLSSRIIKNTVQRARPCHIVDQYPETIVRVHCGSGYSFTSSHATNHFALAFFLPLLLGLKRKWVNWSFIIWAASISISQVYVGVHYPLDIFFGSLLGTSVALFCGSLYSRWAIPLLNNQENIV